MDHGFRVDELTDADLPATVELCRAALDLPEDAAEAASIVESLWGVPGSGRAFGFRAVVDGPGSGGAGGAGVGRPAGVVIASAGRLDPTVGHIDLIAVHPDARRRGIARALLAHAEAALAARGCRRVALVGNPPHYAWPGVDVRYTPAVCLALATGYAHQETAWNMTVDLSSEASLAVRTTDPAERQLAIAGIAVRAATAADLPALTRFAAGTFGGSWAGELTEAVTRPRAGCHLAVRDGAQVLGFAAYGACRPSWFGPMGTAPAARGLGIGGVLLRRCLRDLRAAGHATAEIGWVGPVPFYAREAGARIGRVFFLYRKELR